MEDYLIYDVETFSKFQMVAFSDLKGNVTIFQRYSDENDEIVYDDTDKIASFIEGKILVSYNGYFYDDAILSMLINGRSMYQVKRENDRIISGIKSSVDTKDLKTLDTFKQILSKPKLKKIQGNLNMSIEESSVPFDLDRPLTKKEREEVIDYCIHDVATTKRIFEIRKENYFDLKDFLLEKLEDVLDQKTLKKAYKWNTTTLSANLLKEDRSKRWFDWRLPKEYEYLLNSVPQEVIDLWENWKINEKKGKVEFENYGLIHTFGFGGLHSVNSDKQKRFENVKLADWSSLYPNLIIKLNALGDKTQEYKEILEKRLELKKTDKKMSNNYKLLINSSYGLLNNEHSAIYNPAAALSVCVFGQLLLYNLSRKLFEVGCRIVQCNTDGIAFAPDEHEKYIEVIEQDMKENGLVLEVEDYDLFVQVDVNNYIAVEKNGYIKVKGGDVSRYHGGDVFGNCNTMIIDRCIVEYLVNGVEPLDTILDNLDKPELFQYILSAGRTYLGTCDEDCNLLNQSVNRVFAAKNGIKLYKTKDGVSKENFADVPEKMMVFNDDLKYFDKNDVIDIDFYYQLVMKKLERWK